MIEYPTLESSRRQFLSTLSGTAASIVLWPKCLHGGERKLPNVSFIVVSDTHLGYRAQKGAARQWERTAAEIAKATGDLVLHLGDVVDGGREEQYPVYLKTRETIRKPVHEIPGNHDPQKLFEKYLRAPVDHVVDHQWIRFLLLNNSRRDSHDGFLSPGQLKWIDQQCADAARRDRYVIVCMHVPTHANRHPDRGWYVKPEHGQKEFYTLMQRHQNRVLAVFHGHFHCGLRGWEDHGPVHEVVFPSALYNGDRGLIKLKAPGYNLAEFRPAYTLVRIGAGAMHLNVQPLGMPATTARQCKLGQISR